MSDFLLPPHFTSAHSDTGECPVTSFECLGGRCLPFSWRCNGVVECIDEGTSLGTDEQGCDGEEGTEESPEDPGYSNTQAEGTKKSTDTERNNDRDSERLKAIEKIQSPDWSTEQDSESDLWSLVKEREEEEEQVDRQQPQAHRNLVVIPTPVEWPCGGLLQTFYGTFSPPPIRGPPLYCVWTLDPQDSRPLRLDLQQLVLGLGDTLTVYNRQQGAGDIIKIVSC